LSFDAYFTANIVNMKLSNDLLSVLEKDPIAKNIIEQTEIESLQLGNSDLYISMTEAILSQQLSVKVSDTIIKRYFNLFPNAVPTAEKVLEIEDDIIRAVGVSYQKINYLKSLSAFHQKNGIDREKLDQMSDHEIIDYLLPIKGVGKWTVEMMLIFTLQRPDVFPVDDLAICQKMVQLYGLTETGKNLKKKLISIAENWSPYRSIVTRAIWKYKIDKKA
jgi:DNA-3-methyladenine glycosylase II